MRTPLPLILVLLVACSSAPVDQLPPPYTADAIRAANPTGTELVFAVSSVGGPSGLQTLRFVETDREGAVVESSMRANELAPRWIEGVAPREIVLVPAMRDEKQTWAALRDHARFDFERGVRSRATVEVPAGRFETWLYTVLEEDGSVSRYDFALDRPGPPVRYEQRVEGKQVFLMELVEAR